MPASDSEPTPARRPAAPADHTERQLRADVRRARAQLRAAEDALAAHHARQALIGQLSILDDSD